MSRLQPTVRQLQPLGRRHHPAPAMQEHADSRVRAADTSSPDLTSAPRRARWRRRLAARANPSS
jgi:hypothetical protein